MRRVLATSIVLAFLTATVSYAEDPLAVIEVFEAGIRAPAGMALTPDGDLLVVSREDTSQIFKIDLEHGENKGLRIFAGHRDLCNSRHLAVDSNGYIYIDTSRPTTISRTRSDGSSTQQISWVGLLQVSPDGKAITRIEGIDDDTRGLAVDPEGNLYACTSEVPMEQHDLVSRVAEKSAERMFESSAAVKPRITKFEIGDGSALGNRSTVIEKMDVSSSDMAFNSEGDLFFAAAGNVLKIHFGFFGPSGPKVFATLPTAKAKATKYLGICSDKNDNLYVSVTNPYSLTGGAVFKVDPEGEVTTLAKGLVYPTDCIVDSEGNLYISDLKAGNVLQVPAAALELQGPLRVKSPPPPPVAPPEEPVVAETPMPEKRKAAAAAGKSAPPVGEPDSDLAQMEYRELSENLAAIEKELDEKRPLMYPDTIVLKGGREMRGEIVSETEDAVYADVGTGSAGISRKRIELVVYGTGMEKEQARQAKADVERLELRRDRIKDRMRELRPPVRRQRRPAAYDDYSSEDDEEEVETDEY